MAEIFISPTQTGKVSIVAGNISVTGVGTQFNAAMVGKTITIRTDSGEQRHVIAGVVNATSLILATPAQVTQSNCYYYIGAYQLDLMKEFDYSLNYSIADIRNPEARNSNYTKTIVLPGTANNNQILGHIFEVNIDCSFNPNLRCEATIYQDGVMVFKGSMQLLRINRNHDYLEYEVSIFGALGDLFTSLSTGTKEGTTQQNKLLTDLDLSEYNHIMNKAAQEASWTAPIGQGYVYIMMNDGRTDFNYPVPKVLTENLVPAVYVKTIVDKIFEEAGFTYESNFLNSNTFKRLIIPSSGIYGRKVTIKLRLVLLNISGTGPKNVQWGIVRTSGATSEQSIVANGEYVIPNTGATKIEVIEYSPVYYGDEFYLVMNCNANNAIELSFVDECSMEFIYPKNNWDVDGSFKATLVGTNILLTTTPQTIIFNDDSLVGYDPNDSYNTSTGIHTASVMNFQGVLPQKVTQRDFLLSIIRMFNLYLVQDKVDLKKLYIEPRNNFYDAGQIVDWTDKLDISKDIQLVPMGELDAKFYSFGYKQDNDYLNTFYQQNYNEVYGDKLIAVNNDFLKNKKEIKLIFSPTPSAGFKDSLTNTLINNFVLPTILKDNIAGIQQPMAGNIRILQYGGLLNGTWTRQDGTTTYTETVYPFASHLNDPQTPTTDILFEQPELLFYQFNDPSSYTTNNLFNTYYLRQIQQIINKDAKLVRMYMHLNLVDIATLDFRNKFYIKDAYYYLNKIEDYNPESNGSYLCEFVKINEAITLPTVIVRGPNINNIAGDSKLTSGNISGDLQGSGSGSPAVKVTGINGKAIDNTTPADKAVIYFDAANNKFIYSSILKNGSFNTSAFSNGFALGNRVLYPIDPSALYTQTQDKTVGNTTVETTLIGSGEGILTIPANYLSSGTRLRLSISGTYSSLALAQITFRVYIGSIQVAIGTDILGAVTASNYEIEIDVIIRSVGVSGNAVASGSFNKLHSGGGQVAIVGSGTIDTTIDNDIDVTVQWGAASVDNTITSRITLINLG